MDFYHEGFSYSNENLWPSTLPSYGQYPEPTSYYDFSLFTTPQLEFSRENDDIIDFPGNDFHYDYPDPNLKCTYKSCPASSDTSESQFNTTSELTSHHSEHAETLLHSFREGQKCSWNGCTSNARFSSSKALEAHLNNIHVRPLLCDFRGCMYRKPFRNTYDLKRHQNTAHFKQRIFECSKCDGAFARKDKLLQHERDKHMKPSNKRSRC